MRCALSRPYGSWFLCLVLRARLQFGQVYSSISNWDSVDNPFRTAAHGLPQHLGPVRVRRCIPPSPTAAHLPVALRHIVYLQHLVPVRVRTAQVYSSILLGYLVADCAAARAEARLLLAGGSLRYRRPGVGLPVMHFAAGLSSRVALWPG